MFNLSRCIDALQFLQLGLKRNCFYNQVFENRNISELQILEIGCCFGVDIRRLIADGANRRRVFGVDLSGLLIRLGFELFGDELKDIFFTADATSEGFVDVVSEKTGGMHDVIILQLVLHTVAEREIFLIRNIHKLLKPGGILIGSTLATEEDLDQPMYVGAASQRRVIHSERSLRRLFASYGFSDIALKFSKWNECSTGWIEENFSFSLNEKSLGILSFCCKKP